MTVAGKFPFSFGRNAEGEETLRQTYRSLTELWRGPATGTEGVTSALKARRESLR